jgi:hypothetical protein
MSILRDAICGLSVVAATVCLIAFVATASAKAETSHSKPFACERGTAELEYQCTPKGRFLGAEVNMSAKDAFAGLCANAPDAFWSVHRTSDAAPTPLSQGLRCENWSKFASAKIWTLRVNGYPCVRTRFMILMVIDQKIVMYQVWCHKISDTSLLVDEPK